MTDDTKLILDQLAQIRAKQAEPDYKTSRSRLLTEGFKGLLIINGGGAVALLTFLQASWDKNQGLLRPIVLVGIGWMLAGLVVAVMATFLRFHHSKFGEKYDKKEPHSKFLRVSLKAAYTLCQYGSVACFAWGAAYLVHNALNLK